MFSKNMVKWFASCSRCCALVVVGDGWSRCMPRSQTHCHPKKLRACEYVLYMEFFLFSMLFNGYAFNKLELYGNTSFLKQNSSEYYLDFKMNWNFC